MKILIICSKSFYNKIPEIKKSLEAKGHRITLPNCYDDSSAEDRYKELGNSKHSKWKAKMIRRSLNLIKNSDAVLVLNFNKDGVENYIGGATFLEMYDTFCLGKKIFLYNNIPDGILADEINGFSPIIIEGDLKKI